MKSKAQKVTTKPVAILQNGQLRKWSEAQTLAWLKQIASKDLPAAMRQSQKIQAENTHAEMVRAFFYRALADLELKQKLIEATDEKLARQPRDKLALSYKAHALRLSGQIEEAAEVLKKLLKIAPSDPQVLNSLASAVKELGDFGEAEKLLDRATKIRPDYGKAFWNKSDISSTPEQDLDQINEVLKTSKVPETERYYFHFTAYRLLEKKGDILSAFEHLDKGNRLKHQTQQYSIENDLKIDANIRQVFDKTFIESQQGNGNQSESPIFIFGMPRSGTTLVEQIIASHSLVHGGNELSALGDSTREAQRKYRLSGEFPDWLEKLPKTAWSEIGDAYLRLTDSLKGDKNHLTDKALLNYKTVGLIHLCLPNAKLIYVKRNPMDVCFGCYRQLFSEGLKFSYHFDDLAKIYASHQRLMDHWNQILPGFVLNIKYEELVGDSKHQIQSILDFCKLEAETSCFEPHKTRRIVRTLSASQVRSPIFKAGINRWMTYESQLESLKRALAEQGIDVN